MKTMIKISINGEQHEIANHSNLAALFTLFPPKSTFTCALNGDFVGKDNYQQTQLKQGDSIDVLMPIVGG